MPSPWAPFTSSPTGEEPNDRLRVTGLSRVCNRGITGRHSHRGDQHKRQAQVRPRANDPAGQGPSDDVPYRSHHRAKAPVLSPKLFHVIRAPGGA